MMRLVTPRGDVRKDFELTLDEIAREGARRLLTQALKLEVDDYVTRHAGEVDESGRRLVVKNGVGRPRTVTTGSGSIEIKAPRVDDRRDGQKFTSAILPPYLRKSPKVESLLPLLYLKELECEGFGTTREQRCWVHKIANVLDKLPKRLQPKAKELLHQMMRADTKINAERDLAEFATLFGDKYPKAVECLTKNWRELTAFFDFPASHWTSIRTTNPIESSFATVKLRTKATRGAGSKGTAEVMAFKLLQECEKRWNRIRGADEIQNLLEGLAYKDGVVISTCSHHEAAAS